MAVDPPGVDSARPGVDPPRTEGQRRLLAVDASLAQLAAALGTSKQSVSQWRRGQKTPAPAARALLAEKYGIDERTWSMPPGTAPQERSNEVPAQVAVDIAKQAARATTLDELDRLLAKIRRIDTADLLPTEVARILETEAKVLAQRFRCEREQSKDLEQLEERLVSHPAFLRLVRAIRAALAPHPEALRAVHDALLKGGAST